MNLDQAIKLIYDKFQSWVSDVVNILPNVALAAIILVIGFFIAKKIRNVAKRMLAKRSPNNTLASLAVSVIYVIALGIVVFIALKVVHLDGTVTTLLAGAGIIGLALAFAFQDIASNFMSGIFISFREPFEIGDLVKIKGFMGTVEEIKLRDTTILTFQGQLVTIPNKDVFQNPIENYTQYGRRRIDISGGVSKRDDLEKVRKVALEALVDIKGFKSDDVSFYFVEFGESSIEFALRIWLINGEGPGYLQVLNDTIVTLKNAFDQNGISLPFPMRTLDFAANGEKILSGMSLHDTSSTR